MSYTDLRDFDPEYAATIEDHKIQIEKLGGGTLGRAYTGHWRYIVTHAVSGDEIARGQDLYTGTPKTHPEVVRILAGLFTPGKD
jgi:hypothetical protein